MKKIIYSVLIITSILCLTGCRKEENITGDLPSILDKVYEGVSTDDVPMLIQTEVTKDNEEYYLGTTDLKYKEALASEPAMSSIAHSVVLVRMENAKEAKKAKEEIKEKINPRKWVCAEVEEDNVITLAVGDLVILIMDNQYAPLIRDNFLNLDNE